jgi:hypothetical protein
MGEGTDEFTFKIHGHITNDSWINLALKFDTY